MTNLSLHEIGMKYGTDKATFHKYMDFYESHIDRTNIKRFLEIGVLEGNSLRTWSEWFGPACHVEGWDISSPIHIPGCHVKQIDQLNRQQLLSNTWETWDIVLDDGGHTAEMMQTTFSVLFPHAKTYVIEDLHAPWVAGGYITPQDKNTADLIENLSQWTSPYSTQQEAEYIRKNAELVDVYVQGERDNPISMTAIIRNRAQSQD